MIRLGSIRRWTVSVVLASLVAAFVASPAAVADDDVLAFEGESATTSNFAPGTGVSDTASGGAYLHLYNRALPEGGYVATFDVELATGGFFAMEVDTTPLNVAWASPYTIQVNDGPVQVPEVTELGQVNSQILQYAVAGIVELTSGHNVITFRVDQLRSMDNYYAFFLDQFRLIRQDAQLASVTSAVPLNVFEEGDAVDLEVSMNFPPDADTAFTYSVADYFDAQVAIGSGAIEAGTVSAEVSLGQLPIGHYRITVSAGGGTPFTEEFGVVVPTQDRPVLADSPFGIDVAASWIVPPGRQEVLAAGLERTGVTWLRERLGWGESVHPEQGVLNLAAETRDDIFFQAAADHGMRLLTTFHSAPAWTREPGESLPNNLLAAYEYANGISDYYGDQVDAWEMWNEPDHNAFTTAIESPDTFAAFVKAAAIGALDSTRAPLIAAGAYAGPAGAYAQAVGENEVYEYVDIYGYHAYSQVDGTAIPAPWSAVGGHVALAEQYGNANTRNWMTESGTFVVLADGQDRLTAEQQRRQARGYIADTLLSLAAGTDKQFIFVAAPRTESGGRYFGLLTPSFTPNAVFTAEAALTAALGEGAYVGAIDGVPTGVNALAFNDGDDQVIALWSETPQAVSLDLGAASVRSTNIVGQTETIAGAGGVYELTAQPDVVYLRIAGDHPVTGASQLRASAGEHTAVSLTTGQRVILSQNYPAEISATAKSDGYYPSLEAPTQVTVEVTNLNPVAVTGQLQVEAEGGWLVSDVSTPVTVEAWSVLEVPVQLSAGPNVAAGSRSTIAFSGEFNGEPTSVSAATLSVAGSDGATTSRHVDLDGTDAIRVVHTNTTSEPERLTGAVLTIGTDPVTTATVDLDLDVAAGQSQEFTIEVPGAIAESPGSYSYSVAIRSSASSARPAGGTLVIPDASDVAVARAEGDAGPPTVSLPGSAGLAGDISLAWSEQDLIVVADVTDDVHYQPFSDLAVWQADSVQVAVGAGYPGETVSPGAEYGIALTSDGVDVVRWRAMDAAMAQTSATGTVRRDDAGGVTHYELRIPWTELAPASAADALVSMAVVINDADDATGRSFLNWGDGITAAKDSLLFNPVRLAPADDGSIPGMPDEGSGLPPAVGSLSSDNGWDTGLLDGDYTLTLNTWWGINASAVRLFENGELIEQRLLTPQSPNAQSTRFAITDRPDGRYVYTAELINESGRTTTAELVVNVTDAAPGPFVLSTDQSRGSGTYAVVADLWWGTNATSYRLFENEVEVASGDLVAATPGAQHVRVPVEDRGPGQYTYRIETENPAGSVSSEPLIVTVG